jgi:hypothetical protein
LLKNPYIAILRLSAPETGPGPQRELQFAFCVYFPAAGDGKSAWTVPFDCPDAKSRVRRDERYRASRGACPQPPCLRADARKGREGKHMSDAQSSTTVHATAATTTWSSSAAGRDRGNSRIEPPPWSSSASAHPLDLLPLLPPARKTEKKAAPDVEAAPEVPPTCPAPPAMDAAEGAGDWRERRGSRRTSREEVVVGHAWGATRRPGRGRAPGRERTPPERA